MTERIDTCLSISVGHDDTGALVTEVRFPYGRSIVARAGDPDVGLDETHTVLHDVAHALLSAAIGLRSPVLERVTEARSLSQRDVDLEEAAAFAIQAWCISLRGEDPTPALDNVRTALDRLAKPTSPGCLYCEREILPRDQVRQHTSDRLIHERCYQAERRQKVQAHGPEYIDFYGPVFTAFQLRSRAA